MTRTLVVLATVAVCSIASAANAQPSYPLVCRGGPSMRTQTHAGNTAHTYNILGLFFASSSRAAGPKGRDLQPGQCSWVDRGFRPGEPTILQQQVGPTVTSALWFNDMKHADKVWTFYVFNTNQGVMKVTSAEPSGSVD